MNNEDKGVYPSGTGSSSQNGNGNGSDIRNFMTSFRSALHQVDNSNAYGTESRAESYTPHPMEIIMGSLIPTGSYGQRPRGLLSTPSMAVGAGSQYYGDYDEEYYSESGPGYSRMGFSRRASGQSLYGQSLYGQSTSSRVGIQMMMGFQMFPQRRSPMTPGLAVSLLQMLSGVCGSDCPYHGSERHQHGSEDDGYSGPIITEVSDDEDTSGSGEMLALPSSGTPTENGIIKNINANSENKVKINKNATIRRNVTPIAEGTSPVIDECEDEGLHGNDWMNQIENLVRQVQQKGHADAPAMHTTKMKTVLRRRNLDPYDLDNRQHYEHDEPSTHHGDVSAPTETSNVWKFACDVYAVPPSSEILESPPTTEGGEGSQDDVLYDPNMRRNASALDPIEGTATYYIVDSEEENDDDGDAMSVIEAGPEGQNVFPHTLDRFMQEVDEEGTKEVSIDFDLSSLGDPNTNHGEGSTAKEINRVSTTSPISFSKFLNNTNFPANSITPSEKQPEPTVKHYICKEIHTNTFKHSNKYTHGLDIRQPDTGVKASNRSESETYRIEVHREKNLETEHEKPYGTLSPATDRSGDNAVDTIQTHAEKNKNPLTDTVGNLGQTHTERDKDAHTDIDLQSRQGETFTKTSHDGKVDVTAATPKATPMDRPVTSFSTDRNRRHDVETVGAGTGIDNIYPTDRPDKTNKGVIKRNITDNVFSHEQGVGQTGPNAEGHNRMNYDRDTVHTFQQVKKGQMPQGLEERSDTTDTLDEATTVANLLYESLSFDQKRTEQHNISPNNTFAISYPGRTSAQEPNINTFPIHPAGFGEQTTDSPFQQMVKDHLPPDVPGSQYDNVMGNFRSEDIRTNPISQMFQSQVGTNLDSSTTIPRQHSQESYQGTVDSLNALAHGTNNAANYMQNRMAKMNTFNDPVKQQKGRVPHGPHGSYSSDTAAHVSSGFNDPLEEQHLLEDTALDHPEWQHLQLDWTKTVNTTPKKPARNKNLVMRRTKFSEKNDTPLTTSSTSSGTHISSPNFTSSSYQRNHGTSKATSAYQSNYDDNYYQRSPSTDRLSSLSDHMLKEGIVVKDVYPDGNCFFAAVVDQLRIRGEFYYTAKSLRKAAVKYLREHPKQADGTPLLEFVSDHENMSWDEYLLRQNRDGEWADHIIISAITNVLKRRLVIHSVRRGDHKVNKTIMEPEFHSKSRDPHGKPTQTSGSEKYTGQKYNNVFDGDNREVDNEAGDNGVGGVVDDDEELFEDLMLGHIPEAHYVSLRFADWEEKLFETLKSRKDESQNHLTTYGHRSSRDSMDSSTDSNEDLADHVSVPRFYELPNDHFNFLFTYLMNGSFLKPDYAFSYPQLPKPIRHFFTTWGVGDKHNTMESYLTTATAETNNTMFNFNNMIEPVVWYMTFPHDIVVSEQDVNELFKIKQLIPVETDCRVGYLKVKPVTPRIWGDQLKEIDGIFYLKHLYLKTNSSSHSNAPVCVAIKSDWPEQALECRERMKQFKCDNEKIMQKKVIDGVRVIPVCGDTQTCSDTNCVEWKYSFAVVECVICKHIIKHNAKFCYQIMDHFLNFIFNDKTVITKAQKKAVFYYVCAELDIGINDPSFLEIISHFMQLLEQFLRDEFLPDFFLRSVNLIENVPSEEIAWHYEKAHVARDQYLIYMFLFLDQKGLMDHFKLSKCFDSLLFDAQKSNQNHSHCFARLTVMEARELIMISHYNKAKRLITDLVTEESNDEDEEEEEGDQKREYELHKRVLVGLPLQEKWLYAFYMEYYTGQPLLSHVCDEHDCTKLKDVFGENLIETIMSVEETQLQSRAIRLPSNIAQQEGIACFAVRFSYLLRMKMYFTSAFAAGIHFFLASHTDLLLTTYSSDDSASYPKMIDSLFTLYDELHNHYKHNGTLQQFSSLMEPYTRLCDFQPSISNYEWLSDLLHYFGDSEKASVAAMKADSMRHDQYTKETRL